MPPNRTLLGGFGREEILSPKKNLRVDLPMSRTIKFILIMCLTATLWACSGGSQSDQLSNLGNAPSWTLDSHLGTSVNSSDLLGRAYVVNFMWTHCRDTCPTMSLQMAMLQERMKSEQLLGEEAMLISFSIDPERDTPERLRQYANLFKADPDGWLFLTGAPISIIEVVTNGFGVSFRSISSGIDRLNVADQITQEGADQEETSLEDVTGAEDLGEFLEIDYSVDFQHHNAFVLVDGEGRIRKYYIDVFLDIEQVMLDVKSVLDE